jgi:hypothetical protein
LHEHLFILDTAFGFFLKSDHGLLCPLRQEGTVKQSQDFLENAENCAQLAERASDDPTHKRYKRMEAAWRALAEEQDWLDGQVPPVRIAS